MFIYTPLNITLYIPVARWENMYCICFNMVFNFVGETLNKSVVNLRNVFYNQFKLNGAYTTTIWMQ